MTRFPLQAMKPKKKVNPETILTRSLRGVLKTFRVWHWKQHQGLGSVPGISDVIGIRTVDVEDLVRAGQRKVGVFFACEIKMPGRKPSDVQQAFLDNVLDAGGIAFVACCPEDLLKGLGIKVGWKTEKGGR